MTGSPMISGLEICRCLKERALREQTKEDEKVVRIGGCPTIVKKGWLGLTALRARKALIRTIDAQLRLSRSRA